MLRIAHELFTLRNYRLIKICALILHKWDARNRKVGKLKNGEGRNLGKLERWVIWTTEELGNWKIRKMEKNDKWGKLRNRKIGKS